MTSKYTVFVFLYAVLAPKIYKKVVWKKTVPGPKNVQLTRISLTDYESLLHSFRIMNEIEPTNLIKTSFLYWIYSTLHFWRRIDASSIRFVNMQKL